MAFKLISTHFTSTTTLCNNNNTIRFVPAACGPVAGFSAGAAV